MNLRKQDFSNLDVVLRLTADHEHPWIYPDAVEVIEFPVRDFQVPGEGWAELIDEVIRRIESGQRVLVHCMGGHGRTGLFLASIIAKLEPELDDPVAVMRERYCIKAIETGEQEAYIFQFAGK
jgi:protein-tyrosine phosphatase